MLPHMYNAYTHISCCFLHIMLYDDVVVAVAVAATTATAATDTATATAAATAAKILDTH